MKFNIKLLKINYYLYFKIFKEFNGDWGLGIGDWAQSPIPNPQSPIPNPQRYELRRFNYIKNLKMKKTNKYI